MRGRLGPGPSSTTPGLSRPAGPAPTDPVPPGRFPPSSRSGCGQLSQWITHTQFCDRSLQSACVQPLSERTCVLLCHSCAHAKLAASEVLDSGGILSLRGTGLLGGKGVGSRHHRGQNRPRTSPWRPRPATSLSRILQSIINLITSGGSAHEAWAPNLTNQSWAGTSHVAVPG